MVSFQDCTMNRFNSIIVLIAILGCHVCLGFQAPLPRAVNHGASSTSLNVFGQKKKSAAQAEEAKYWQGEWVCKDCGYIYNRVS